MPALWHYYDTYTTTKRANVTMSLATVGVYLGSALLAKINLAH